MKYVRKMDIRKLLVRKKMFAQIMALILVFTFIVTPSIVATTTYETNTFNAGDTITAILTVADNFTYNIDDPFDPLFSFELRWDGTVLEETVYTINEDLFVDTSFDSSNGELIYAEDKPAGHGPISNIDYYCLMYWGEVSEDFISGAEVFIAEYTALTSGVLDQSVIFDVNAYDSAETAPCLLTVTVTPAGGDPEAPYTVTAVSDTSTVETGQNFSVDVKLTANPQTNPYAAVQAELTYDPALVSPVLEGLEGTVSERDSDKLTITYGPSSGGEVGEGVTLATIPFTPLAAGTAIFTVSEGATVTLSGGDENNELEAAAGTDLEVEITAAPITAVTEYAGAPDGYKLLTYAVEKTVNGYTYNGESMYWSAERNAYLYLVTAADYDESHIASGLSASIAELDHDGDVNGNAAVRISDAQIVYDIINAHENYEAIGGLGIKARLEADVNGDGAVTQADIDAIVNTIHGAS